MDWWNESRQIQILVDNKSWILPYANQLCSMIETSLKHRGDRCHVRRSADDVQSGDILLLLGCTRIVGSEILALNRRNLIVHESDLPMGRGFAPVSWQVLDGAEQIEICLLEAAAVADAGDVFLRQTMKLDGTELCDQLRDMQGQATISICMKYLSARSEPQPVSQTGESTTYARRAPADSQLNPTASIAEQFNLLRICDNERYPGWFEHRGKRFVVKIFEESPAKAGKPSSILDSPATNEKENYIVAGCKTWNRESFDKHVSGLPGRWHYIGQPDELTTELVESQKPEHIFFLHWSWMVPEEILARANCVCFHITDLPYGRGGSPLQNLIARGHRETVLTALQMTAELDAGPIYLKRPLSLDGTAAAILRQASDLSFDMIDEIIRRVIVPRPQSGEPVIFQRRTPEQSRLENSANLQQVYDQIRMLDGEGYPPAFVEIDGFRYELSSAKPVDEGIEARVVIRPVCDSKKLSLEKSA